MVCYIWISLECGILWFQAFGRSHWAYKSWGLFLFSVHLGRFHNGGLNCFNNFELSTVNKIQKFKNRDLDQQSNTHFLSPRCVVSVTLLSNHKQSASFSVYYQYTTNCLLLKSLNHCNFWYWKSKDKFNLY